MLQLKALNIEHYRTVEPHTVLEFGPGFNVLLGKNGVGKTTLLNLIADILNDDDITAPAQTLALSYRLEIGHWRVSVEVSVAPSEPSSKLTDSVAPEMPVPPNVHRRWRVVVDDDQSVPFYWCEINGSSGTCQLRGHTELGFTQEGTYSVFGGLIDGYVMLRDSENSDTFRDLIMQLLRATRHRRAPRYDEALDCFSRLADATVHFQSQAGSPPQREYFPSSLVKAARSQVAPDSTSVIVGFDEDEQLARVLPLLGFESGHAIVQLETRSDDENGDSTYRFRGVNIILRSARRAIGGDSLSFGQKRLLAFYWYLGVRQNSPVVADELANGFHHEWIERCVDEISSRQSFLTSQNPLLLDYVPMGSNTVLIQCSLSRENKVHRRLMQWRNFTPAEVESVAQACSVGIQHVSEILRDQGLW